MIDKNALRAEIVRNGMTQKQLAAQLGISEQTFTDRMKKGVFRTDEVEKMVDILHIENLQKIFFAKAAP